MLDSGAYSAWNMGASIDVVDYAKYIIDNIDHIDTVVNLDVIPGSSKGAPTPADIEAAAAASWDNYMALKEFSINAMPVFHLGERYEWLEKMLDSGTDYIGLGGLARVNTRQRILWLDDVFERITDAEGRAIIKVHGFGITGAEVLFRYPWYTADSTTWIMAAGFGTIVCPSVNADGSWRFDHRIPRVVVSDESDKKRSRHFDTLTKREQETVLRFIAEAGTTLEECRLSYWPRRRVNAYFFKLLSDANLDIRFKRKQRAFFERA